MKQQFLLIDGENFVHALVHCLMQKGAIRNRLQLHRLDCSALFSGLQLSEAAETCYYTTKIQIKSAPKELQTSLERVRKWNDRWVPYLANQGIKFVKAGNLRVRNAETLPKVRPPGLCLAREGR